MNVNFCALYPHYAEHLKELKYYGMGSNPGGNQVQDQLVPPSRTGRKGRSVLPRNVLPRCWNTSLIAHVSRPSGSCSEPTM